MLYLRPADWRDAPALARLRAASLLELELLDPAHAPAFTAQATAAFARLFAAECIAAWIACDGVAAVASSCAVFYDRLPYPEGSRHAEICGVYVLPAHRNCGIGTELVREVVAAAAGAGARKVFLRPSPSSKALYGRLGFVTTDLMTLGARRSSGQERVRLPI